MPFPLSSFLPTPSPFLYGGGGGGPDREGGDDGGQGGEGGRNGGLGGEDGSGSGPGKEGGGAFITAIIRAACWDMGEARINGL